ncbi:diacylglycerol kinase family lipid kinase [Aliiglaciecola sp. CAU 1673]|uniref:diacylglycerol/lipid kinase family protein n=1 Tax=Aliiglaciecola sp. CAU 1673 TaxID=3032595 RepID=UPI0023DA5642|nr:diacylglycerol kinase family protein [Aliiglaciecola sp. CAU 1673]MDF2176858.1 diacylglycerol kinase family lipid kinase [Aliiglaciecola sp. CAU 1673]
MPIAVATKYLIIVNPLASDKKNHYLRRLTEQLQARDIAFDIFETDANELANQRHLQQCVSDYSDWVMLGGDGTINLMVNMLAGSDVRLGILPCGSGNDFARNLYAKGDDPLAVVLGDKVQRIDLGRCNERYFANVLGIGFDGDIVAQLYDQQPRRFRQMRYLLAALRNLFRYQEQMVELQSATQHRRSEAFMLTFANGRYFGGGMQIAPKADIGDGLLDCCWVGKTSLLTKLYYLGKIFKGKHLAAEAVEYWQDSCFDIPTADLPIEADGEFFGTTPALVEIVPQALNLKVPV